MALIDTQAEIQVGAIFPEKVTEKYGVEIEFCANPKIKDDTKRTRHIITMAGTSLDDLLKESSVQLKNHINSHYNHKTRICSASLNIFSIHDGAQGNRGEWKKIER